MASTGCRRSRWAIDGLRLHLYVPDDTGRLLPALEHDDPVQVWLRGWDPGVAVVGRAYSRRRTQVGRGEEMRAEGHQQPGKQGAFSKLEAVVAVPLLNLTGRPVAVLSAASDGEPDPGEPAVRSALEALSAGLVRTHPRRVRLTPGQRDRIVREVRAERAEREALLHEPSRRRLPRSA